MSVSCNIVYQNEKIKHKTKGNVTMWTKILFCLGKRPVKTVEKVTTGTSLPPKREFYIQGTLPLDFSSPAKKQ